MQFIVETGVGIASANSYVSMAYANAYAQASISSGVWQALPLDRKESLLVGASRWLDQHVNWKGERYAYGTAFLNSLRWPREGVYDSDGLPLANNIIPEQLKHAVCEVAIFFINPDNNPQAYSDRYGLTELTVDVITLRFQDKFNAQAVKSLPGLSNLLRGLGYLLSSNGARAAPINKT